MDNVTNCTALQWQRTAVLANVDDTESRMEHRWGNRLPCRARACVWTRGGIAGVGRLRNVSLSGAFLETTLPLTLFGQVSVAVLREDGATHFDEMTAVVVRCDASGVGIEWTEAVSGPICRVLGCESHCAARAAQPASSAP